MKYFSIPSDFKTETIDKLYELNKSSDSNRVIETYGQITIGNILNSGRVIEVLPQISMKELEEYVKYSKERGISFNYTLNPACFGNLEFSQAGIKALLELLQMVKSIGINSLTVTTPSLIELVKLSGCDFEIKASAICEITSPGKALFYKGLGVKRAVVDPDITRDFRRLRNITHTFGDGVEIIINNVCYKNCAYKMFHYNHEAHCTPQNTSQTIRDYYFNRCSMQKAADLKNPIKLNWIRPEDIKHYYEAGIRYFKLQGRQNVVQGDIIRTLTHYFREDFDGNLFDLITIFAPYNAFQPYIDNKKLDGYIDKFLGADGACSDVCASCGYCEAFARKSMNSEKARELNEKAVQFYKGYDRYTKEIKNSVCSSGIKKLFDEDALDLELNLE